MLSVQELSDAVANPDRQQELQQKALRQAHTNYKAALIGLIERRTLEAIGEGKKEIYLDYDRVTFDSCGYSIAQILFGDWVRAENNHFSSKMVGDDRPNGNSKRSPVGSPEKLTSWSSSHQNGHYDLTRNREAGINKSPLQEIRELARDKGYNLREMSDPKLSRRKILRVTFPNDWQKVK